MLNCRSGLPNFCNLLDMMQFIQEICLSTMQLQTPNAQINEVSIQDQRIVITKDSDLVNSFLAVQQPYKLLLITMGNIKNSELEALFIANLPSLVEFLQQHAYVELIRDLVIVHQ